MFDPLVNKYLSSQTSERIAKYIAIAEMNLFALPMAAGGWQIASGGRWMAIGGATAVWLILAWEPMCIAQKITRRRLARLFVSAYS